MVKNVFEYRSKHKGFFEVKTKIPVRDSYSLSLVYTPGVGRSCLEINENIDKSFELTNRANSIAVLTDCSNFPDFETINPLCAIPMAETKAAYYKQFAGIDAYPIVLNTHSVEEIAQVISNLAPTFAGFDLDDFLPERTAIIESWFNDTLRMPILFSYRKPNIFLALQRYNLEDKINPQIITSAIMRGAMDVRATMISDEMYGVLGLAIQDAIRSANSDNLPNNELNLKLGARIAYHVAKTAIDTGCAQIFPDPEFVEEKYLDFLYEGERAWFEKPPEGYNSTEKTLEENSIELHRRAHGVIETNYKLKIRDIDAYNKYYSPSAIDMATKEIELDYTKAYDHTPKGNLVAIITDGSAVLGLGNIGAEAALPVMEGKAVLFKELAGVDAIPICLKTQDPEEIINTISHITPILGGINLEDISSPRCFDIERKLIEKLNIPVFHDDQHGTAVVVLAGFINALKLTGKKAENIKLVVNGAGAGAIAVSELLINHGVKNIVLCDTKGAIYKDRKDGMNHYKEYIAEKSNPENLKGSLEEVIKGADFFAGLSVANVLTPHMVKSMAKNPVIFALANPIPEIMPDIAKNAGAYIVATGRSDLKNQINNSLAFPGIFRGTLDVRAKRINTEMKVAAAEAIAHLIKESELNPDYIIPHALDLRVPPAVAKAVAQAAISSGVAQTEVKPDHIFERTKNYLLEGFLRNL